MVQGSAEGNQLDGLTVAQFLRHPQGIGQHSHAFSFNMAGNLDGGSAGVQNNRLPVMNQLRAGPVSYTHLSQQGVQP